MSLSRVILLIVFFFIEAGATLSPTEKAFIVVPSNESAKSTLEYLTSEPHMAGTPGDAVRTKCRVPSIHLISLL